LRCCKGRLKRYFEAVPDSSVVVHHTIADAMLCTIILRSRSVRNFFFLVCV